MERCWYQRMRVARTVSLISGKLSLKFTPALERMLMLLDPLGVGHNAPIMESLYDRNQSTKGKTYLSTERLEDTFGSSTTTTID